MIYHSMVYNQILFEQVQHLIVHSDGVVAEVVVAVGLQLVQVVSVVDHDAAGVDQASPGGVRQPVDPPETGAVAKMKVCD